MLSTGGITTKNGGRHVITALYQLSYATTALHLPSICKSRILPETFSLNEARNSLKEDKNFIL
jgi:hypothetical protein